jgi:uncharacterized protein (TIRG00374 family)
MKKKITIPIIVFSVIIGLVIIVKILQEIPLLDVIATLENGSQQAVIGFVAVSIVIMLLHAWRWQVVLKAVGEKHIPFKKIFAYKVVGYGISFITPIAKVGGEPLRAMLLQRHGISFRKGFSTVVMDKLIDLFVTGVLLFVGIILAVITITLPKNALLILVSISITVIGLLIWFYFRVISKRNVVLDIFEFCRLHKIKKLNSVRESIIEMDNRLVDFHKEHKKAFNKSVLISFSTWLLMFVEYKTALMIVGINNISFAGLFLIIAIMGFTYMLPVPLALGVLEAGQISTFSLLRLNTAAGVALSMIIRARDLFWTFVSIILVSWFGFNFKKVYNKTVKQRGLRMPREE